MDVGEGDSSSFRHIWLEVFIRLLIGNVEEAAGDGSHRVQERSLGRSLNLQIFGVDGIYGLRLEELQ